MYENQGYFPICSAYGGQRVCTDRGKTDCTERCGEGREHADAYAVSRADLPGSEGVTVKNFTLEREGGKFTFEQGDFYFYTPVEGRVTGAVFVGKGGFDLTGQDMVQQRVAGPADQRRSSMQEEFTMLVLRFADDTADEIRKASAGASKAPPAEVRAAAEELANGFRKNLHNNVDLRLLADVLGDGADGRGDFFLASFRMGDAATGRNVLFLIDPEGTFHASPDEVELIRRERRRGAAMVVVSDGERKRGRPGEPGAGDGREAGRDVRPGGHDEEFG